MAIKLAWAVLFLLLAYLAFTVLGYLFILMNFLGYLLSQGSYNFFNCAGCKYDKVFG
jgi:hypothetical protein